MSSKNPISFAFSVLFEIAAVVAIVSVLPRVNLRPTVSASQDSLATLPLQTTDLRTSPLPSWANTGRNNDQVSSQAPPLIEATPASPRYVEQQLDRASQRLLNSVGGAVNQASQDWLRPVPPPVAIGSAPPANTPGDITPISSHAPTGPVFGAGYAPETSYAPPKLDYLPPAQNSYAPPPQNNYVPQPAAKQTAPKPSHWQTASPRTPEQRPWLRY